MWQKFPISDAAEWRKHQSLAAVGLELSLSPMVGMGLGFLLDRWLGTDVLRFVGLGFGFLAGFRALFRTTVKAQAELEEPLYERSGEE